MRINRASVMFKKSQTFLPVEDVEGTASSASAGSWGMVFTASKPARSSCLL